MYWKTSLQRQAGITLVELICVLVVLGALAASALIRFVNLTEDAHRAGVAGTAAAFGSAASLANAACIVRGWQGRDNLPGYGDGRVDFNTNCFPADSSGNANVIANSNARCMRVWNAILATAPTVTTGTSGADYRARASNNVCTYRYLLDTSTARQFTYDSRSGLIVQSNP